MRTRVVSSTVLVGACFLIVVVGVANAGRAPAPRVAPATAPPFGPTMGDLIEQAKLIGPSLEGHPLPAAPEPSTCQSNAPGVQNIHVRPGPMPDYFAEGKALGMSDDGARAYAAQIEADRQEIIKQTLTTLPPLPCP